jgi:hypothetical protein
MRLTLFSCRSRISNCNILYHQIYSGHQLLDFCTTYLVHLENVIQFCKAIGTELHEVQGSKRQLSFSRLSEAFTWGYVSKCTCGLMWPSRDLKVPPVFSYVSESCGLIWPLRVYELFCVRLRKACRVIRGYR